MPDLVKLRNRSGSDLEVAFLQGREVKAGGEVEVAGRVVTDPAEAHLLMHLAVDEKGVPVNPQPLAADALHIAHPTADGEQLLAWPLATWELAGGTIPAGQARIVGEAGPEIVIPAESGTVVKKGK